MGFKKKPRLCMVISIALIFVICFGATVTGAYPFHVKTDQRKEIANTPYSIYSPYGILYDEKTDSLFYNHERIRYFEDNSIFYNGDGTTKGFFIFYTDKTNDGNIDIYTVYNSQNELTGIRVATEDEFMEKTQTYISMIGIISDYKKYGIRTDIVGNMYFEGFLVRELYDPVTGTLIQTSRGAGFPEGSIDIEAVYDNGSLSAFKIVSQEEYDLRTQERMEAVQDFWVEKQNQRN